MNAVSARLPHARVQRVLLAIGVGALAVVLGLLVARSPALGLAGFAGLAAVVGFSRSGTFAVCAFIATTYLEVLADRTGDQFTPIKLAGGALILVAVAALAVRVASRTPPAGMGAADVFAPALRFRAAARLAPPPSWRRHPVVVGALGAFLLVGIASAGWAADVGQVRSLGQRLVTDALVFLAVGVFLHRPQQIRALGWTLLGSALASTLYGLAAGSESFGRFIGGFYDPNEFAAAVVPALALGVAVSETSAWRWRRIAGRLAVVPCLYGLVATESRSGVVALGVALLVLVLTARGIERVRVLGGSTLLVAIGVVILTITPAGGSLLTRLTQGDSTGRTDLWRVALYQFADEPLHGVGLGNYPVRSREYLRSEVSHTELFVAAPRTTHNTVLEIMAELGVIGIASFGVFVGGVLVVTMRALRRSRNLLPIDAARYVPLGRGLVAATFASLASGMFLSGQYQELLWVLLGSGIAYAAMVDRCAARERGVRPAGRELNPPNGRAAADRP